MTQEEMMQIAAMVAAILKGTTTTTTPTPPPPTPPAPTPGNPFGPGNGNDKPINYDPDATSVDATTGEIYRIAPGGRGWISTGEFVVPASGPPTPRWITGEVPPGSDYSTAAVARRSANVVVKGNVGFNSQKFQEYITAYGYWSTSGRRTQEPPNPAKGYYRMVDEPAVYALISNGRPVPIPPEINYNQPTYPAPPTS